VPGVDKRRQRHIYHYVAIELDDGIELESCRRGNSVIIKIQDSISILDGVAELKRFLTRNGIAFPVVIKDNVQKIVDPVLLCAPDNRKLLES
jgi:hypothetical protein